MTLWPGADEARDAACLVQHREDLRIGSARSAGGPGRRVLVIGHVDDIEQAARTHREAVHQVAVLRRADAGPDGDTQESCEVVELARAN